MVMVMEYENIDILINSYTADLGYWQIKQKVSRLRLYKMRGLKYNVENKALYETWK